MKSWRQALGLACLVLLALAVAPPLDPREAFARLEEKRDPAFAFDSRYRAFLDAVGRSTPPSATVAVLAPETSERYLRLAAYELAPRRVVGRELSREAQYLAVYRRKAPPIPTAAQAMPGGFLLKR
jgi:hypothetical protein